MAPTRELAVQINEESKKFAFKTGLRICVAYGGAPFGDQVQPTARCLVQWVCQTGCSFNFPKHRPWPYGPRCCCYYAAAAGGGGHGGMGSLQASLFGASLHCRRS